MRIIISILSILCTTPLFSQSVDNQSSLVLSEIMKGNQFIGHQPENIRWSLDGAAILFDWNPTDNPGNSRYAYTLKDSKYQELNADFYQQNTDYYGGIVRPIEIYSENGNLYRFDRAQKKSQLILRSTKRIRNIQRIPTKSMAYFQQGNGFFLRTISQHAPSSKS